MADNSQSINYINSIISSHCSTEELINNTFNLSRDTKNRLTNESKMFEFERLVSETKEKLQLDEKRLSYEIDRDVQTLMKSFSGYQDHVDALVKNQKEMEEVTKKVEDFFKNENVSHLLETLSDSKSNSMIDTYPIQSV
jgi:hypothetical protein